MLIGCCGNCRYTDLLRDILDTCPRCGARMVSLGIDSIDWNDLDSRGKQAVMDATFPPESPAGAEPPIPDTFWELYPKREPKIKPEPAVTWDFEAQTETVNDTAGIDPEDSQSTENTENNIEPIRSTAASQMIAEVTESETIEAEAAEPEVSEAMVAAFTAVESEEPEPEDYGAMVAAFTAVESGEAEPDPIEDEVLESETIEEIEDEVAESEPIETEDEDDRPLQFADQSRNRGKTIDYSRYAGNSGYVYVCYRCNSISGSAGTCHECGSEMIPTGYTTREWTFLSKQEKRQAAEDAKIRHMVSAIREAAFDDGDVSTQRIINVVKNTG